MSAIAICKLVLTTTSNEPVPIGLCRDEDFAESALKHFGIFWYCVAMAVDKAELHKLI